MQSTDVLIQGAGIVGRALALGLGPLGLRVTLRPLPAPPVEDDVRAYALNAASVALLRQLRVWDALPAHAVTPVYDMQVQGDAQATLSFSAWQQGVAELAWIVDVPALEAALDAAVRFAPHIQTLAPDAPVPPAALTAVCEGRHSATRDAAGVQVHRVEYGQTAIAARLSASLPHAGVARQWFRSPDVLALLPCAAGPSLAPAYALVWSLPSERAAELMAATDHAFEAALTQAVALAPAIGTVQLASRRSCWPLSRMEAEPWCGPGWVLVGDAAHGIHPLAGQGLNLGLADVVSLQQVLREREPWRGPGDVKLLRRHARRRALPTRAMGQLTGGLMHLFAHPSPWARELRNHGLNLVEHAPGFKRWLTAQALNLDKGA
jgi:2-polyprenyl-6-methoxyphenol hydroxylase-like FAD-dependent oxidoreductase